MFTVRPFGLGYRRVLGGTSGERGGGKYDAFQLEMKPEAEHETEDGGGNQPRRVYVQTVTGSVALLRMGQRDLSVRQRYFGRFPPVT